MKLPVDYNALHWKKRKLVREEYVRIQNGLCYHCGTSLNEEPKEDISSLHINRKLFPRGFFKYPIHLHHSHDTGYTIGAVHSYCNAVLWQYHNE